MSNDTSQLDTEIFLITMYALSKENLNFKDELMKLPEVQEAINSFLAQSKQNSPIQSPTKQQQQGSQNQVPQTPQAKKLAADMFSTLPITPQNLSSFPLMSKVDENLIASTSVQQVTYQRSKSATIATQSSTLVQAQNVTKRQEVDLQMLRQKMDSLRQAVHELAEKHEAAKKQLEFREQMLARVKLANQNLQKQVQDVSNQQLELNKQVELMQKQNQNMQKQADEIKQLIYELAQQHPDFQIHVRGSSLDQQINSLFSQLSEQATQKIFFASKQGSLKVFEQETSILDQRQDLGEQIVVQQKIKEELEGQLSELKKQYHQIVIQREAGK